ncbi:hypothetical protein MASR1M32_33990 [Rhodobacter sp.]
MPVGNPQPGHDQGGRRRDRLVGHGRGADDQGDGGGLKAGVIKGGAGGGGGKVDLAFPAQTARRATPVSASIRPGGRPSRASKSAEDTMAAGRARPVPAISTRIKRPSPLRHEMQR